MAGIATHSATRSPRSAARRVAQGFFVITASGLASDGRLGMRRWELMGRFDTEAPVHSGGEHNEMKRGMLCRYYRWRKLYGNMGRIEVRRCKDLEKENGRLRAQRQSR